MLYERWLQVVRATPHRLAVWEGASGRHYTFQELETAAGNQSSNSRDRVQFASGAGVEFILSVLGAWRDGKVRLNYLKI